MAEMLYCEKCRKTMKDINFYTYRDGRKTELCKACLTLHVDNWDPETFLWLLEKFDVPWIEPEWAILRDRAYAKDPYKVTGISIFGKYLSKMRLIQHKDERWADTERLKAERDAKAAEAAEKKGKNESAETKEEYMREALANGSITEAQYKTFAESRAPEPSFRTEAEAFAAVAPPKDNSPYPANNTIFEEVEIVDVGANLNAEDKIYLAMKWGRLYPAADWVSLEQLYDDFMESFDIQGAARVDTLKMICKTSLKMNQAIDCGDVDTYQKLSRVYDAMMKSAKFTEAQNKEKEENEFSCFGQVVSFCEKEGGFIPEHVIEADFDVIDKIIKDLKTYNETLIKEDPTLAAQIEQYIKRKEIQDEMEQTEKDRMEGIEIEDLSDKDFIEYKNNLEEQCDEDKDLMDLLLEEE